MASSPPKRFVSSQTSFVACPERSHVQSKHPTFRKRFSVSREAARGNGESLCQDRCFGSGSVFTETKAPRANSTMGLSTFRLCSDCQWTKLFKLPAELVLSFGLMPHIS